MKLRDGAIGHFLGTLYSSRTVLCGISISLGESIKTSLTLYRIYDTLATAVFPYFGYRQTLHM